MAQAKKRVSARVAVPKGLTQRKLDELAQEMVAPLQELAGKVDLAPLKASYGRGIGTIAINSLHDKLTGHLGAAGYESKLWEKACC